jgi:hypothetical protein
MLSPLIVGFSLEQIDIDSLASQFEELVLESHRTGMSEDEITSGLFNVMQNKATKVYTLMTIPVYSEPEDADNYVSIWLDASDTPSARKKHRQGNVSRLISPNRLNIFDLRRLLDSKNTEGSQAVYHIFWATF